MGLTGIFKMAGIWLMVGGILYILAHNGLLENIEFPILGSIIFGAGVGLYVGNDPD